MVSIIARTHPNRHGLKSILMEHPRAFLERHEQGGCLETIRVVS